MDDQVVSTPQRMTLMDRAKYFVSVGVPLGIALEVASAGSAIGVSLILAALAGGSAAYFSEEIRSGIIDKIAGLHGSNRNEALHWLLTGNTLEQIGEIAQPHEDVTQVIGADDDLEPMEALQPKPASNMLPRRSPKFAEMRHLIVPGTDILGYDGEQFIFADSLTQSVNMAAIGLPRSGKTVCLTYHVAQAVLRNAIVRGWDLHGDVVKALGGMFHVLDDVEEILEDCQWLDNEIKRRSALRKRALSGDGRAVREWEGTRELLYIVDEFLALMTRLKMRKPEREMVANIVLLLIAEGAKFKMRIILAGQTMPAALFGEGGSSARDIIGTKYAFQSRDDQARRFGIEQSAIEVLLSRITGDDYKGYAVLDGGSLLRAKLVSIPFTTVEDIRSLLDEGYGEQDEEEDLMDYMVSHRHVESRTEDLPTRSYTSGTRTTTSVVERRQAREQRLRETAVVSRQVPAASVPETPRVEDDGLTRDERNVLEAYRSGLKTGNAIAAETGISSTRVNQSLNRLARLELIDWQPRKV